MLVGRLFKSEDQSANPVTGPSVSFVAFPGYHGPKGFFLNLPKIIKCMWKHVEPGNSYILRIPATIPTLFAIVLWLKRIPFAVEVVADP